MATIIPMKGMREAPKAVRSSMDTIIVTPDEVNQWRVPPFQRPIRVNEKVRAMAEDLRANGCEITGILTLGKVGKDPALWIIDGQHRIEAFRISAMKEVIVDVRICHFDRMAEAADEFVRLNSSLVKMRPDDVLRGLESTLPSLQMIRKSCEFVGYDNIRRGHTNSPVLGMSAVLRCWTASGNETPAASGSTSAAHMAEALDVLSAQNLIVFLSTAHAAWGRDPEYYRLWGNLNLSLCMWMWRRLVLDKERSGLKRYVTLTPGQFKQCLMSVSAAGDYVEWLHGRNATDRDRAPCFARLKTIFIRRLAEDSKGDKKPMLPQPAWSSR